MQDAEGGHRDVGVFSNEGESPEHRVCGVSVA
eukprot:SAG31_NODE_12993_length_901_cov_0.860349_1_plen_31_part_10